LSFPQSLSSTPIGERIVGNPQPSDSVQRFLAEFTREVDEVLRIIRWLLGVFFLCVLSDDLLLDVGRDYFIMAE